MAHKGHRAKRGFIPKTTGGKVGLIFKIAGAVVIAGPAISAVSTAMSSNAPDQIPWRIAQGYTGFDPNTGGFSMSALTGGVASIAGGVTLIYLGKYLGKMIH